jgi:hypothetical protein
LFTGIIAIFPLKIFAATLTMPTLKAGNTFTVFLQIITWAIRTMNFFCMYHMFFAKVILFSGFETLPKKLYAREKIDVLQTFRDVVIPANVLKHYERITHAQEQLANVEIVLDGNCFKTIVDEVKNFYSIKFLTKEDVEYMHQGMVELLEYYTTLAITGKNALGNLYKLYLSNLSIDSNIIFYKANNNEISELWIYPEQSLIL